MTTQFLTFTSSLLPELWQSRKHFYEVFLEQSYRLSERCWQHQHPILLLCFEDLLDLTPCSTAELKHKRLRLKHQFLTLYCKMLIDNNISFSPSLSCLFCLSVWLHLSLSYFCLSDHPPIFLSFYPSPALLTVPSDPSFLPVCLSVCLSSCLSCPGCVDSSSVSCRRSVLLRHGHWSDACTLSADGQATILSFSHFFSPYSNFLSPQKFILPVSSHAAALNLSFSVICLHLHPDHLVAGELTERETGRQTDRKHTIPWRALLRKSASQVQSIFPLLSMSPMLCLHLDPMPACNDVPSEMKQPQTNSSWLLKHKRGTE